MSVAERKRRIMAPFTWYGGKGKLHRWVSSLMPPGEVYVEPFAGAASLFWHREPSGNEVLNDLHQEIINLYRVLQDAGKFQQLQHRLEYTPYSRDEFRKALSDEEADDVSRAWAFFVRQNQGFGGMAKTEGNWGRKFTTCRGMAGSVSAWRSKVEMIQWWHQRLQRVQLENRCAIENIKYWDSAKTVFYIDPPYVLDTRKGRSQYNHECDDDFHRELVSVLIGIEGNAAVSGYDHEIYRELERHGWSVQRKETVAHAAGRTRNSGLQGTGAAKAKVPRTETLWVKG